MHITVQEDAGWLTLLGITAILLLLSLALLIHLFAFHCYLSKSFYLIKCSNEFSCERIWIKLTRRKKDYLTKDNKSKNFFDGCSSSYIYTKVVPLLKCLPFCNEM